MPAGLVAALTSATHWALDGVHSSFVAKVVVVRVVRTSREEGAKQRACSGAKRHAVSFGFCAAQR